jgi:hypothetical protein
MPHGVDISLTGWHGAFRQNAEGLLGVGEAPEPTTNHELCQTLKGCLVWERLLTLLPKPTYSMCGCGNKKRG